MAPANIASRYLSSLEASSPERLPLQASHAANSPRKLDKHKSPDLDDMARQMNLATPHVSLRCHLETPSAIVSSFRAPASATPPATASRTTRLARAANSANCASSAETPRAPQTLSKSEAAGYEYLCRVQAIKAWLEAVIGEPISQSPAELLSYIRNGIHLAKLANVFLPTKKPVYASDTRLEFRHTENINRFFRLLHFLDIPALFHFELTDLYDAKDVPKVWFCLHAMSYIINASNAAFPPIRNLVGDAQFSPADIKTAARALAGHSLPNFSSADTQGLASPGSNAYMNSFASPSPKKFQKPAPAERENPFLDKSPAKPQRDDALGRMRVPDLSLPAPAPAPVARPAPAPVAQPDVAAPWDSNVHNVVILQALARGSLCRYDMFVKKIMLKSFDTEFTTLLSVVRGNLSRARSVHRHRDEVLGHRAAVVALQAAARGKMSRRALRRLDAAQEHSVTSLQTVARGWSVRKRLAGTRRELHLAAPSVTRLQCITRGQPVHRRVSAVAAHRSEIEPRVVQLQAAIRRHAQNRRHVLSPRDINAVELQAVVRGGLARNRVRQQLRQLCGVRAGVLELQSIARGAVLRTRLCNNVLITLLGEDVKMNELFAKARAGFVQKECEYKRYILHKVQHTQVVPLQAAFRGILARYRVSVDMDDVYEHVDGVIALQARIRGGGVRRGVAAMEQHYRDRVAQVVRAQAVLRSAYARAAYRALVKMKNPPLAVIRQFADLLADCGADFEEEAALAALKDRILDTSRGNDELESQIENLDIKLGLLDKNKISVEDFMRPGHRVKAYRPAGTVSVESVRAPVRRRLELYSSMFYLLQTKPAYWVRLYGAARSRRAVEQITQTFGVARAAATTRTREEFFFVRLVCALMEADMARCASVADITKAKCTMWADFFVEHNNSAPQRAHLKRVLAGPVARVVDDDAATFESDPARIHAEVRSEELRAHGESARAEHVSAQAAIADGEVSRRFVRNLMALRDAASDFFECLAAAPAAVPVHVRLVCRHAWRLAQQHFPAHTAQQHLAVAGVVFVKHYVANALQNPGNFGYAANDRARDNLRFVGRVLVQVVAMRPFSDNFMKPLNDFVAAHAEPAQALLRDLVAVRDVEAEYEMNEYDDLVAPSRPQLTMAAADMAAVEQLVAAHLDAVAPAADDPLRGVFADLRGVASSATDVVALADLGTLTVALAPRTSEESAADGRVRALFAQAKRCVVYMMRVQPGDDLLELFIAGIRPAHEARFRELVAAERRELKTHPRFSPLGDLAATRFSDLKKTALKVVLQLEASGHVARSNAYQELLNQLAVDIKTKHSQRLTRSAQVHIATQAVQKLLEKEAFLQRQLADYNTHIDGVLAELQRRPSDKKLFSIIPLFSKQYFYHRQLKKNNRLPKFGSYKYSAKRLLEQGVLLDMGGSLQRKSSTSSKVDFMFSCHKAGVFLVEAAIGTVTVPGACNTFTLDQVLEKQYENTKQWSMFDGMVTFDTESLSALIFKNFYDIRKD